jgi:peptidylprolyl isomerase
VIGLSPGESRTITIPVDQAYGPHNPEMVIEVPRGDIPDHIDLTVGNHLQMTQENGQVFTVLITGVTDAAVTLDANHALAGRELVFDLKLVEIV